jgi:hypothetical protein
MLDRMSGMGDMKLFRSKKVLLEDGLQEAGILVGQEGKIDRILRRDELGTLQHNAEVGMHHIQAQKSHLSSLCYSQTELLVRRIRANLNETRHEGCRQYSAGCCSCEHCSEPWGSVKAVEFRDRLYICQLLKKGWPVSGNVTR